MFDELLCWNGQRYKKYYEHKMCVFLFTSDIFYSFPRSNISPILVFLAFHLISVYMFVSRIFLCCCGKLLFEWDICILFPSINVCTQTHGKWGCHIIDQCVHFILYLTYVRLSPLTRWVRTRRKSFTIPIGRCKSHSRLYAVFLVTDPPISSHPLSPFAIFIHHSQWRHCWGIIEPINSKLFGYDVCMCIVCRWKREWRCNYHLQHK